MKKLLPFIIILIFSVQLVGQSTQSKYMRNHIVSKYPKYTFEDASSTALLILDGKVSDIDEISVVGRKQFSKLTFYSGK